MSKELDLGRVVGKDATINGQNAINIVAGNSIDIQQQDGTLTIGVDDTHFNDKSNPHEVTADQVGAVPVSRTVNGKQLNENISLSAADVGAASTDHSHDDKQDKISGIKGQVACFDDSGNIIAKTLSMDELGYALFGFQINPDESDPSKIIKYIAQNTSYDPAFMDYEKDEFNYGDWANAWFIKNIKVVSLKNDGAITYELNPNRYNYEYRTGNIIPITNFNNVMVGIPTVWIKYQIINGKDTFYFSDIQLDNNFHAYAHTAADGSIMSYTYLAAYNGWKDNNGNMRSLSSKTPTTSETFPNQIEQARANNPEGKHMWDIDTFVDRNLINLLLLLIGKSTNTQDVFGSGNLNGLNYPVEGAGEYGILQTGTMDTKGLFYGFHNSNNGVKVFGIENWWGNVSRRAQGLILNSLYYKIKLTYGTEDGSTCEGYNLTGDGYIDADIKCPNNNGGYIKLMAVKNGILLPFTTGGSASTYYCDSLYVTTYRSINFPTFGGYSYTGFQGGAFIFNFTHEASSSPYYIGVCLSCKPY